MGKFNFKSIGMRAAGAAAGGAGGALINKVLPNMNPKVRAAIKLGAGVILPELAPKSKFVGDAGVGLAAVGAFELANTMLSGSVNGSGVYGVGDPEYKVDGNEYQVEGANDHDSIGKNNAIGEVEGAEDVF